MESYYEIPKLISPGPKPTMRCCVYKERAIVQERVRLAMGGDRRNPNIIEVIEIACDECPVERYMVSEYLPRSDLPALHQDLSQAGNLQEKRQGTHRL